MSTTFIQDNIATETTDAAAVALRLLAEFEVAQVGGGENVAGFF